MCSPNSSPTAQTATVRPYDQPPGLYGLKGGPEPPPRQALPAPSNLNGLKGGDLQRQMPPPGAPTNKMAVFFPDQAPSLLPPGLAQKETLPPGLASRETLPPGLAYRGQELPPGLARREVLPPGLASRETLPAGLGGGPAPTGGLGDTTFLGGGGTPAAGAAAGGGGDLEFAVPDSRRKSRRAVIKQLGSGASSLRIPSGTGGIGTTTTATSRNALGINIPR